MFSRVVFHFFPWHDLKNFRLHFISQSTEVISPVAQQKQCTPTYKSFDPGSNFITQIIFPIISHSTFIQINTEQNRFSSHSGAFLYNFFIRDSASTIATCGIMAQDAGELYTLIFFIIIMLTKITTAQLHYTYYKLLYSMLQIESEGQGQYQPTKNFFLCSLLCR